MSQPKVQLAAATNSSASAATKKPPKPSRFTFSGQSRPPRASAGSGISTCYSVPESEESHEPDIDRSPVNLDQSFDIQNSSDNAAGGGDSRGPALLSLGSHGAGASALARLIERRLWSRSSVRALLCERLLLQKLLPVQALHFVIAMLAQLPAQTAASTTVNGDDDTSGSLAHEEASRGDGRLVALAPTTLRLVQLWGNTVTLTQLPALTQVQPHRTLDSDSADVIAISRVVL